MLSNLKLFERIILIAILTHLFICCEPSDNFSLPWYEKEEIETSSTTSTYYPIKWISDGDTFWIDDGSERGVKVRLIGIDAPESVDYGNKLKQEFGEEAHKYAVSLLKGKKVRLSYDIIKYDKYGRTLAYAFLEDGTFVNKKLIEMGYAVVFTYPPNLKYAEELEKAEDIAIYHHRGLWALKAK